MNFYQELLIALIGAFACALFSKIIDTYFKKKILTDKNKRINMKKV